MNKITGLNMELPVRQEQLSTEENKDPLCFLKNLSKNRIKTKLELDFLNILEFSSDVKWITKPDIESEYDDSLIKVSFHRAISTGPYIPCSKTTIYSVKRSKELTSMDDVKLKKWIKKMENYCRKNKLIFKIVTEKEIRNDHLKNVYFLKQYGEFRYLAGEEWEIFKEIRHETYNKFATTPKEIVQKLAGPGKESVYYKVIWLAVSVGELLTDLNKRLTVGTKLVYRGAHDSYDGFIFDFSRKTL